MGAVIARGLAVDVHLRAAAPRQTCPTTSPTGRRRPTSHRRGPARRRRRTLVRERPPVRWPSRASSRARRVRGQTRRRGDLSRHASAATRHRARAVSLGLALRTSSGAGGGGDGDRCRAGGGGARGQTGSDGGGGGSRRRPGLLPCPLAFPVLACWRIGGARLGPPRVDSLRIGLLLAAPPLLLSRDRYRYWSEHQRRWHQGQH